MFDLKDSPEWVRYQAEAAIKIGTIYRPYVPPPLELEALVREAKPEKK